LNDTIKNQSETIEKLIKEISIVKRENDKKFEIEKNNYNLLEEESNTNKKL